MDRYFGEQTWEEAAASRTGKEIVIVPVGAFEQHGPHLPLDVDMRLASKVSELSAQSAKDKSVEAYVTPPVWIGFSPHHMDFCGTITHSSDIFIAVLSDVCRCLNKHGFKKILIINGHGGNAGAIRVAVQNLFLEEGIRIMSASYWDFAGEFIRGWRDSAPGGIDHACEMETALMQYLYPESVREDKIQDYVWFPQGGYFSGDLAVGAKVGTCFTLKEITPSGVAGAPSLASAEKGRSLLNYIVEQISDFLVYYSTLDAGEIAAQGYRKNSVKD